MKNTAENLLSSNWLSVYDELSPEEYEAIDEKEEVIIDKKEDDLNE